MQALPCSNRACASAEIVAALGAAFFLLLKIQPNLGNRPAKAASPCVGAGKPFCHGRQALPLAAHPYNAGQWPIQL
jgi:hypothetical protein